MSRDRFPGAKWAPLPETGTHGRYVKTQLIFHSTGTRASAAANRRYFADAKIKAESTFIVDYNGGCLQIMEAYERTDANTTASKRAISVEVVGEAGEPYTAEQVRTCQAIAEWACREHPIERRQIPAHDQSGIGWHVMFGAPGPWTSVRGKECPGPARIRQVRERIIPAVAAPKSAQEDDMTDDDRKLLRAIYDLLDDMTAKRRADKADADPNRLSLADLYTQDEKEHQ